MTIIYIFVCHSALEGRSEKAAEAKWKEVFNDPDIKRDQVEAVNEEGESIGKARPERQTYDTELDLDTDR